MNAHLAPLRLLLITCAPGSSTLVAEALEGACGAAVEIAPTLQLGHEALRNGPYHVVLLEEAVPPEHPEALEALYELAGSAVLLEISFGLVNTDRIVRQVRRALRQQLVAEMCHGMAARRSVQMELRDALAGLRLQSELALRTSGPEHTFHLTALADLAESIAFQVEIGGAAPLPAIDLHHNEHAPSASA